MISLAYFLFCIYTSSLSSVSSPRENGIMRKQLHLQPLWFHKKRKVLLIHTCHTHTHRHYRHVCTCARTHTHTHTHPTSASPSFQATLWASGFSVCGWVDRFKWKIFHNKAIYFHLPQMLACV